MNIYTKIKNRVLRKRRQKAFYEAYGKAIRHEMVSPNELRLQWGPQKFGQDEK